MSKPKFVTVSIPANELERLREIAEREHRSMAQQITYWIEQSYLQHIEQRKAV